VGSTGLSGELPTPFWTFNWLRQASRDEIELTVEIDQTYPLDQWPKRSITPSNTNAREGSTRNRLAHVDARGLRTPRPQRKNSARADSSIPCLARQCAGQ
jgi:hypothetical protein